MPMDIVDRGEKRAGPNDASNNNLRHSGTTKRYDAVGSSRSYESDLDDEPTSDRIVRQRVL